MTDIESSCPEKLQMRERPVPPSSANDPNTLAHLQYALNRQVRERDAGIPTDLKELRSLLREQSKIRNDQPSDYIKHLLESLDDDDITPELFDYALGLAPYAPTEENDALRSEDEDTDE